MNAILIAKPKVGRLLHIGFLARWVRWTAPCLLWLGPASLARATDDPPVFEPIRKDDREKVKQILDADPAAARARNERGETPLHVLSAMVTFGIGFSGSLERVQQVNPIAEMLVAKGADLDATDNQGQTPLFCAIGRDQLALATFLIDKGADVNRTTDRPGNYDGVTPLHVAVGHGHMELIKLLASKRANLNAQMKNGNSPLHIAAIYNYPVAAKVLVELGAERQLKNQAGQTPLEAASAAGNRAVVEALRPEGGPTQQAAPKRPNDARVFHTQKPTLRTREIALGEVRRGGVQESLVLSADQRHLAYRVKNGDAQFVVLDGIQQRQYEGIGVNSLVFSAAGQSLAYVALRHGETFVVHSGEEYGPFPDVADRSVVLSGDGKRIAYAPKRPDGRWFVRMDSADSEMYDEIGTVMLCPAGRRVAYAGKAGDKWFVVVDGVKSSGFDGVAGLRFSPNGERFAYGALRDGRWIVFVDDKEVGKYQEISDHGVVFSSDSTRFAFTAASTTSWSAVVDGVSGASYDRADNVMFSPSGERLAFRAVRGGEHFVVINGKEGKAFEAVGNKTLCFSPDSKHIAFGVVQRGTNVVVQDGVEGTAYEGVSERMVFSPDSQHLAYMVSHENGRTRAVVVDGIEGMAYPSLLEKSIVFNEDSTCLAYMAGDSSGYFFVINGKESGKYDGFLRGATLVWDSATKIHGLAIRNSGFYCVEVEWTRE